VADFRLSMFSACYSFVLSWILFVGQLRLCVVGFYFISFLFMRFMLRKKKMGVTMAIQARLMISSISRFPRSNALDRFTVCARGRTAFAKICMDCGSWVSGKNVPLNRNIGVMKRNHKHQ
jgi:hypothetical protein